MKYGEVKGKRFLEKIAFLFFSSSYRNLSGAIGKTVLS